MSGIALDHESLLGILIAHGVRFVVIGGMAAIAHGSPYPTTDIDITPAADSENFARLSAALTELGASVRIEGEAEGAPFAHDGASLAESRVWNLRTRHGDLDISVVPSGTQGYADLVRSAEEIDIGIVVPIALLADVIRSKQAANRLKDQRVLPVLREILASRHQEPPHRA